MTSKNQAEQTSKNKSGCTKVDGKREKRLRVRRKIEDYLEKREQERQFSLS